MMLSSYIERGQKFIYHHLVQVKHAYKVNAKDQHTSVTEPRVLTSNEAKGSH